MKFLLYFILFVILLDVLLFFLLVAINIFQNGPRKWQGKSLAEILGMDPEAATVDNIKKLSRASVLQLFYAAEAPELGTLSGEHKTKMLHVGLLGWTGDYYVNYCMGPGHWEGDAFELITSDTGHGYNIFSKKMSGEKVFRRALQMDTYIGQSTLDDKNAVHVSYRRYGKGLNKSMRDEIRRIKDNLYLGVAFFSWTGGRINPFPFVVYDKIGDWVGPDH